MVKEHLHHHEQAAAIEAGVDEFGFFMEEDEDEKRLEQLVPLDDSEHSKCLSTTLFVNLSNNRHQLVVIAVFRIPILNEKEALPCLTLQNRLKWNCT
jgi:hypothetical protein